MIRARFALCMPLVALLALAGCDDDPEAGPPTGDGGSEPPTGDAGMAQASLRVIHLSPDAPAVDVHVDDDPSAVVSELAFEEGTEYLSVPAADYDVDVAPAGEGPGASVLAVDDLSLAADIHHTAVAFDELASIQALALVDELDGVAAGDIRVRAVHTASAVGEVDIWNVTDPGSPAVLYEDVAFGDVGDYLDLPAAAYSIGFDVDDDAEPDLVFDLPDLPAGTVANVFAVSSGSDVFLIAQLEDGTVARIDPAS
ncbi:MAG: DUF4397 domain-containing protein [Myxococcota bacterium]